MDLYRRIARGLFLLAAGWCVLGGGEAEAGRIRHGAGLSKTSRLSFGAFLEAGPGLWDHATPRLPHRLALGRTAEGAAMPSLFLDYLTYRRGLNTARFDAHHPHIAGLVAAAMMPAVLTAPPAVLTVSPQVVDPTTVLHPPLTQSVPEPSTALIAGLLVTAFAVARSRRRSPFSGASETA